MVRLYNVGPASQTVAQHYISIGPMYRVIWVVAFLATGGESVEGVKIYKKSLYFTVNILFHVWDISGFKKFVARELWGKG